MSATAGFVYCFGHVSTGTFLRLQMPYPQPDGYAEVAETLENHAGEATGTALVLARLGHSVRLEGNWIGDTPACRRTLGFLESRSIDTSGLLVKPGYPGATEIVVSDGRTRTVFGRYCDLLFTTRQWEMPEESRLRGARHASVDPAFGEATLRVARLSRNLGIPLAACDAGPDSELAACSDLLVVSNEFLRREHPDAVTSSDARRLLFQRYLRNCPGLVVFTSGSDGAWFGRSPAEEIHSMPAFQIDVVDSAGAGDSFRGGLIHARLRGWNDAECVRFASAVAALVCTRAPGCVHPPSADEIAALYARDALRLPA